MFPDRDSEGDVNIAFYCFSSLHPTAAWKRNGKTKKKEEMIGKSCFGAVKEILPKKDVCKSICCLVL